MQKNIIKHWPLVLAFTINLFVYKKWVFSLDPITAGDWVFFFKETMISLRLEYFTTWLSDFSTGRVLIDLAQAPSYSAYGVLAKYLDFDYGLAERVVHLWPIVFITPISIYILLRKYIKSNAAIFIGMSIFIWNTYFLTLQTGHVTLMASFVFMPICFLLYSNLLDRQGNEIFFTVLTGLCLFISLSYEPRAFYITSLLLLGYLFFNLLTEQNKQSEKLKTLLYGLLPFIILLALSFYWLFPVYNLSLFQGNDIFNRGLFGNNFWKITYSLSLHHPWWSSEGVKVFVNQPIAVYFWLIPIFAFVGSLLSKKNKTAVFFTVVALAGIFLSKQVDYPFPWVYPWLFSHIPGFNAFREASKFYSLIAISYAVLISFFIDYLIKYNNTTIIRKVSTGLISSAILMISISNTFPILNEQIKTLFIGRIMPSDYVIFGNFLSNQREFSRTLWIPRNSNWGYYDVNHPIMSYAALVSDEWKELSEENLNISPWQDQSDFLNVMTGKYSNNFLDILSIKYIVVPLFETKNDDDLFKEYYKTRQYYIDVLNNQSYLKKVPLETSHLVVYENKNYRPHIYATKNKETIQEDIPFEKVDFEFRNSTEYVVHLKNVSSPVHLNFSEKYHPDWRVRVGVFHWIDVLKQKDYFLPEGFHLKNDSKLNSFVIDPKYIKNNVSRDLYKENLDGSIDVNLTLYFKPQSYFKLGLIISGVSLVGCLGYLGWYWVRRKMKLTGNKLRMPRQQGSGR